MNYIARKLQHCINALGTCAGINGFTFSSFKPVCVHKTRRNHTVPVLMIKSSQIAVVTKTMSLCVVNDHRLTFWKFWKLKSQTI